MRITKSNMSILGRLVLLSILSLTLTEPVHAGFRAFWTRQHVTGNQQEKALASLNVPKMLPEMALKLLNRKLAAKKPWVMPRYSLYLPFGKRLNMKDKKSSSRVIRKKITRLFKKNTMFSK